MSDRTHRARPNAAELLGRATRAGAEEALSSLINQFADPYSFLRELIQNSLDAGSTQIDVDVTHEEGQGEAPGRATIAVVDNGEGMNELVIDQHLLTLFSSTKENDLTKIGKFGIGFVSIFALEPDLVVVETGQAGEAWRVLFHADARYEKLRLDYPVEGTHVSLHLLGCDRARHAELVERSAETVRYWCKLADAEIFVNGELVRQPFTVEADLCVRHEEPGTELVVGLTPPDVTPLVGFYNRGLTLVEGAELPGGEADLAGLSFRIKSRYLEHTLTRDNVLQDASYDKAMALLRRQVEERLVPRLIEHLEALARGEVAEPGYGACLGHYAELPLIRLSQRRRVRDAPILATTDGAPVSLKQARRARSPVGPVLAAPRSNPLTTALAADGTLVLVDAPGVQRWLRAACGLQPCGANEHLVTAVCSELGRRPQVAAWLRLVGQLLGSLDVRIEGVHLGDLAYVDSTLAAWVYLRQRKAFGVSLLNERPGFFGGARQLVLNASASLVQRCLALAEQDVPLAALLCAQAVAAIEGGDPQRAARLARSTLALAAGGQGPVSVRDAVEAAGG